MTATGIALIAGGLATLIGFRKVLWPGRKRRPARTRAIEAARRPARTRAIEAARRRARDRAIEAAPRPELSPVDGPPAALLPAQAGAPDISGAHLASGTPSDAEVSPCSRGSRRRGRTGANVHRAEIERAGLASIGLADEEPIELDDDEFQQSDEWPEQECPERANTPVDDVDIHESHMDSLEPGPGDEQLSPPTGDYWMPVPESAYAELDSPDYGWPVRSDRDPAVECEPTAVVPVWPPARPFDRIELPRTWSQGAGPNLRALRESGSRRWSDMNRNDGRGQQANEETAVRYWDQLNWDGRDGWRRNSGPEDHPEPAPRRRPRPRPNPAAEARSTVYVSKHAAE